MSCSWPRAARYCSRPATSSCGPASLRTGCWRTIFRYVSRSNFTSTCGAMSPGNDVTAAVHPAVVLLSGGLDSATALAIARRHGHQCYALSVAYGQRHSAELDAAARVAAALGAREHRIMHVDLAGIGGSALTDPAIAVPEIPTLGIPVTYVPARNTMLLALALGWAEVLG